MDERIDKLIEFIFAAAAREDYGLRELSTIHVLKYLYLADLEHARRREGQTFTGIHWTFYRFGPWARQAQERIEQVIPCLGLNERRVDFDASDERVRWYLRDEDRLDHIEDDLPVAVTGPLRQYIHEYANQTSRLLHFVYCTEPMRAAAPNEILRFEGLADPPRKEQAMGSVVMTAKERKRHQARVTSLRERLAERRAERQSQYVRVEVPYDDLYFRGTEWLDEIAGGPVTPAEGELVVDASIWKSATRTESGED